MKALAESLNLSSNNLNMCDTNPQSRLMPLGETVEVKAVRILHQDCLAGEDSLYSNELSSCSDNYGTFQQYSIGNAVHNAPFIQWHRSSCCNGLSTIAIDAGATRERILISLRKMISSGPPSSYGQECSRCSCIWPLFQGLWSDSSYVA